MTVWGEEDGGIHAGPLQTLDMEMTRLYGIRPA
jgi:hypothetical protein